MLDRRTFLGPLTQDAQGQQHLRGGVSSAEAALEARLNAVALNAGIIGRHVNVPQVQHPVPVGPEREFRRGRTAEVEATGASRYLRIPNGENVIISNPPTVERGESDESANDRLRVPVNGNGATDDGSHHRTASAPVVITTPAPAPLPAAVDVPVVGTMPEIGHVAYITVQTPEGRVSLTGQT